jgi:hypothetical protein
VITTAGVNIVKMEKEIERTRINFKKAGFESY